MSFLDDLDSQDGLKAQIMAAALVHLLTDKGIITAVEYQALAKRIGERLGVELGFKIEAEDG